MLVADTFRDRRVFLVGESAHVNPPWGGHGFNTCVGDAVNIRPARSPPSSRVGLRRPAGELRAGTPRRGRADRGQRGVQHARAGRRAAPGRGADPARQRAEFHSLGLVLGYSFTPGAGHPAGPAPPAGDVSRYTPGTEPGARLPHAWLPDGSSLYDRLGSGFTLAGPALACHPRVADLAARARRHGIPLTLTDAPPDYSWPADFLLVRPDKHIAGEPPTRPSSISRRR